MSAHWKPQAFNLFWGNPTPKVMHVLFTQLYNEDTRLARLLLLGCYLPENYQWYSCSILSELSQTKLCNSSTCRRTPIYMHPCPADCFKCMATINSLPVLQYLLSLHTIYGFETHCGILCAQCPIAMYFDWLLCFTVCLPCNCIHHVTLWSPSCVLAGMF